MDFDNLFLCVLEWEERVRGYNDYIYLDYLCEVFFVNMLFFIILMKLFFNICINI